MCRVGTEHDPAPFGSNAHDLHAARMSADLVYGDARSDLAVSIVKLHAACKDLVDHGGDAARIEDASHFGI